MFEQQDLIQQIKPLKKFALRLTHNSSDAEDLVQSTILRAMEKRHLFQEGTDLFRWMSKVMFNIFVSGYRRKTKFETQYDPDSYIQKQSVEPSQDVKVDLMQVQDAMNRISHDHREILVMVCVKGMQYTEVSEMLKIPVGTVRSRLSRAREALQVMLDTPKAATLKLGSYTESIPPYLAAQENQKTYSVAA
ncbi:MAG: sigma-70 family RNA polymerase sigma factor [Alphaproteobacteria bacterium]|nr:sigma-70 family RNA polymerase sigma factor [Alphaproteobacteria bacterium]